MDQLHAYYNKWVKCISCMEFKVKLLSPVITSKMMQNNRSCNCNIQGCSATPILWNVNKEVTYLTLLS